MARILNLLLTPLIFLVLFLASATPAQAACNANFSLELPPIIAPGENFELTLSGGISLNYNVNLYLEGQQAADWELIMPENADPVTFTLTAPATEGQYRLYVDETSMSDPNHIEVCYEEEINVGLGGNPSTGTTSVCTESGPGEPKKICEIVLVIEKIIGYLAPVAAIVFLIMMIFGGYQFMMSGGDPKAAGAARGTLTFAILGIILVVASWLILLIIKQITGVDVTIVHIPGFTP